MTWSSSVEYIIIFEKRIQIVNLFLTYERSALFSGLFKNCSSHQGWMLTPKPCFDNYVSLGLNVSNFDQDENPRSGQVWLLWTPISCFGQMLRNDVLRIVESLQL